MKELDFFNIEKVRLKCHDNSFQIYKRLLQRGTEYIHDLSLGDQWETDLNCSKEDVGYTSEKKTSNNKDGAALKQAA